MLRVLLAKDLRRALRNPVPWVINLIVPLAMTALLGMVLGRNSEKNSLGQIRCAVVNEDRSELSALLRAVGRQGQVSNQLEMVFTNRTAALNLVNADKISAVLIIDTNFTRDYLSGNHPITLHLIKNPVESIHPAVIEEAVGAAVTGLNALSRNFSSDISEWQRVFEGGANYLEVPSLLGQTGRKLITAGRLIYPPLVGYDKNEPASETNTAGNILAAQASTSSMGKSNGLSGVFASLLVGLSAMFLLFLGQNALTDLHRELRIRTFERYRTLHQQVWQFIFSKIVFAVVMLLICNAVMLGGGALLFGIHWQQPGPLAVLALAYSCFVAALFSVLVALVPDERRAGVLNNLAGMALGLAGGCAFPPRQLPDFLRLHITPLMPSYWFANAGRILQSGGFGTPWGWVVCKLMIFALVLMAIAAWLFQRKFKSGLRT